MSVSRMIVLAGYCLLLITATGCCMKSMEVIPRYNIPTQTAEMPVKVDFSTCCIKGDSEKAIQSMHKKVDTLFARCMTLEGNDMESCFDSHSKIADKLITAAQRISTSCLNVTPFIETRFQEFKLEDLEKEIAPIMEKYEIK